jgi:hypothetical protein
MRGLAASFLAVALGALPAAAQEARDGRTVEWYGRNPYMRMTVLDQCRNDPGRLRNHPDCINAQRADLADASRRLTGTYQGSPNTPEWFSHHPDMRRTALGACRNMNAEARRQYGLCEPARQSIVNDQLRLTGRLPAEVQVR